MSDPHCRVLRQRIVSYVADFEIHFAQFGPEKHQVSSGGDFRVRALMRFWWPERAVPDQKAEPGGGSLCSLMIEPFGGSPHFSSRRPA